MSTPLPKKLPPPSPEVVFPPVASHTVLEAWKDHTFAAQALGFSPVNAWWMAELSLLAYAEPELARSAWERSGLAESGWELEFAGAGSTHALVVVSPTLVAVAFRGTRVPRPASTWEATLRDLATDADLLLEPWPAGGRVHRGFARALDSVWQEGPCLGDRLEELAATARRIWFAGHSLGAALATLAAHRWRPLPAPEVGAVYTFGSPRVGDRAFAAIMPHPVYRMVNNNDVVAHLPPAMPYQHVGELHYFDAAGRLLLSPEAARQVKEGARGRLQRVREWLTAAAAGSLLVPGDGVVDHSPLYYALLAWNHYILTQA